MYIFFYLLKLELEKTKFMYVHVQPIPPFLFHQTPGGEGWHAELYHHDGAVFCGGFAHAESYCRRFPLLEVGRLLKGKTGGEIRKNMRFDRGFRCTGKRGWHLQYLQGEVKRSSRRLRQLIETQFMV